MLISFTVPGEPRGKGRPKFARAGNYVKTYTPETTASYENLVKLSYQQQCKERFSDDAQLEAYIYASYSIPKSASKKTRTLMLQHKTRPTKKPDADNVAKIICDALNGLAYRDDSQIVTLEVRKQYSDTPQVTVHIYDTETTRRLNNCGTLLSDANKNGCEVCKKMVKLITGIL